MFHHVQDHAGRFFLTLDGLLDDGPLFGHIQGRHAFRVGDGDQDSQGQLHCCGLGWLAHGEVAHKVYVRRGGQDHVCGRIVEQFPGQGDQFGRVRVHVEADTQALALALGDGHAGPIEGGDLAGEELVEKFTAQPLQDLGVRVPVLDLL